VRSEFPSVVLAVQIGSRVAVPLPPTLPPPAIVLHPNPVPEVQISALVAPEHEGIASSVPAAADPVALPNTVFAVRFLAASVTAPVDAELPKRRPSPVRLETPAPPLPKATVSAGAAALNVDEMLCEDPESVMPVTVKHCGPFPNAGGTVPEPEQTEKLHVLLEGVSAEFVANCTVNLPLMSRPTADVGGVYGCPVEEKTGVPLATSNGVMVP